MNLPLDDYGKPELEPSYYDYDILDDADKGKNERKLFHVWVGDRYFQQGI